MHRSPDSRSTTSRTRRRRHAVVADAVFYQVYVRSFADTDGDGVGDLAGIRDRLDYLQLLGVDALWLTPFYPSPGADHGYDVADPRDVDPLFGDLAGFDALVADAHAARPQGDHRPGAQPRLRPARQLRGGARRPGAARHRQRLPLPGRHRRRTAPSRRTTGSPSSAVRPGPGSPDGQWYLHLFAPEQPDLDWTNPEVAADLERTLRFWLDRGRGRLPHRRGARHGQGTRACRTSRRPRRRRVACSTTAASGTRASTWTACTTCTGTSAGCSTRTRTGWRSARSG